MEYRDNNNMEISFLTVNYKDTKFKREFVLISMGLFMRVGIIGVCY